MADQNPDTNNDVNQDSGTPSPTPNLPKVDTDIEAIIAERLKPIKSKLDTAFAQRDEANTKLKAMEEKARADELARLKEEGKFREAAELQVQAAEAARKEALAAKEAAEQRVIELTRDVELKSAMSGIKFRSEKASEIAFSELAKQFVRDANGNWVSKNGQSVRDAVKAFSEDAGNSFLIEQKVNVGGGSGPINPSLGSQKKTSVFDMTQDEVIKLAQEGKLPQRQKR